MTNHQLESLLDQFCDNTISDTNAQKLLEMLEQEEDDRVLAKQI